MASGDSSRRLPSLMGRMAAAFLSTFRTSTRERWQGPSRHRLHLRGGWTKSWTCAEIRVDLPVGGSSVRIWRRMQLEQVTCERAQHGRGCIHRSQEIPPPPPLPLSQVNDFEAIGRIRRRMNKFKPLSGGSGISCKRFCCMRKQLYAVLLHNEL